MIKRIPKWIWLISIAFIVMQYLICLNVYMMGDDYMYGTFGHEGVFTPVFSYYFTGNGRWLINIFDSLWLLLDRYLYIILMPWLVLLLAVLIYRFICAITNRENIEIFAITLGLLSIIDILMTCETTYWITGSMNYLILSLFLIAGMTSTLRLRNNHLSSKEVIINGILCILSCLTMEQYGLMAIGWMLLIWGYDCFKQKNVSKRNVVVFIVSLVALSSIIFAPGNFVRVDDAAEKGTSLFIKIIDLIYYDYYSKVSASFVFILAAFCAIRFFRSKKKFLSIVSALNAAILLICFDYGLIKASFLFVIISILVSLITIVPTLVTIFKKNDMILLLSLAIVGGGSQIMLLATQLWGFRTSMSWILIYIICILAIFCNDYSEENLGIYLCILCMAINQYLGIAGILIGIFLIIRKKAVKVIPSLLLLLVVVAGLADEVIGYNENRDIHTENIKMVEYVNNHNEVSSITILPYDDEQYGWTSPPLSEFHERYFRSYYNIPDDVDIMYAED